MGLFVEFHALTSHSPANLNRDRNGTPKTAMFGGARRLRISSQCLKRTWRTFPGFVEELPEEELAVRTTRLPETILGNLGAELPQAAADGIVAVLAGMGKAAPGEEEDDEAGEEEAGKPSGGGEVARTPHLLMLSRKEIDEVGSFVRAHMAELAEAGASLGKKGRKGNKPANLVGLREALRKHLAETCRRPSAVVALFGRFYTGDEIKNIDGALSVAHALSTQQITLEYDYFSAVDDLQPAGQAGSAHIGEGEFGAGVFYKYAVADARLLAGTLGGDRQLAARSLRAVTRAVALAVPRGSSHGAAPFNAADYLEVVVRRDQPMSLANAFLKPVRATAESDLMESSIKRLTDFAGRTRRAYVRGPDVFGRLVLSLRDLPEDSGATSCESLDDLAGALEKLVTDRLGKA